MKKVLNTLAEMQLDFNKAYANKRERYLKLRRCKFSPIEVNQIIYDLDSCKNILFIRTIL